MSWMTATITCTPSVLMFSGYNDSWTAASSVYLQDAPSLGLICHHVPFAVSVFSEGKLREGVTVGPKEWCDCNRALSQYLPELTPLQCCLVCKGFDFHTWIQMVWIKIYAEGKVLDWTSSFFWKPLQIQQDLFLVHGCIATWTHAQDYTSFFSCEMTTHTSGVWDVSADWHLMSPWANQTPSNDFWSTFCFRFCNIMMQV